MMIDTERLIDFPRAEAFRNIWNAPGVSKALTEDGQTWCWSYGIYAEAAARSEAKYFRASQMALDVCSERNK